MTTWQAVHGRLRDVQASASAAPPLLAGRGIRQRYFLTGFARCVRCGGSMQAVSRSSSLGRSFPICAAGRIGTGLNGLREWTDGGDARDGSRRARLPAEPKSCSRDIVERALDSAMAHVAASGMSSRGVSRGDHPGRTLADLIANWRISRRPPRVMARFQQCSRLFVVGTRTGAA